MWGETGRDGRLRLTGDQNGEPGWVNGEGRLTAQDGPEPGTLIVTNFERDGPDRAEVGSICQATGSRLKKSQGQ